MARMSDHLKCVVVTPERTILDTSVEFVALPLYDGEVGIAPGRAPMIGRLGYGEMRTNQGGTIHRYFVDGGFAQVRDDVVTVLTNRAQPAEQIDVTSATAELERAKIQPAKDESSQALKAKEISRARARLRVALHR